jgi:hypothetical protein
LNAHSVTTIVPVIFYIIFSFSLCNTKMLHLDETLRHRGNKAVFQRLPAGKHRGESHFVAVQSCALKAFPAVLCTPLMVSHTPAGV